MEQFRPMEGIGRPIPEATGVRILLFVGYVEEIGRPKPKPMASITTEAMNESFWTPLTVSFISQWRPKAPIRRFSPLHWLCYHFCNRLTNITIPCRSLLLPIFLY